MARVQESRCWRLFTIYLLKTLLMCMYVCKCEFLPYKFKVLQGTEEGVKSPGAAIKGSYELSHMGPGN